MPISETSTKERLAAHGLQSKAKPLAVAIADLESTSLTIVGRLGSVGVVEGATATNAIAAFSPTGSTSLEQEAP
jgi:hypothetical protein